jgi:hypothetical protein
MVVAVVVGSAAFGDGVGKVAPVVHFVGNTVAGGHDVYFEQVHASLPDHIIFHHLSEIFCMLNETFFTFNKYI